MADPNDSGQLPSFSKKTDALQPDSVLCMQQMVHNLYPITYRIPLAIEKPNSELKFAMSDPGLSSQDFEFWVQDLWPLNLTSFREA